MKEKDFQWRVFGRKRHGRKGLRFHHDRDNCCRARLGRKVVRNFQARHGGRLPDLSLVPRGNYCYATLQNGVCDRVRTCCPYLSFLEVLPGEEESHPGLVAEGQTRIGACALLGLNDDELGGYGLLWDEVKECPF